MATSKKTKKITRGPRKTKRQRRIAADPELGGLFQRDVPLLEGIDWAHDRLRKLQGRPGYYPLLTETLNDSCTRIRVMLASDKDGLHATALSAVVKLEGHRIRQEEAQLTWGEGLMDALALVKLGLIQGSVHQEGGTAIDGPKVLEDVLAKARSGT